MGIGTAKLLQAFFVVLIAWFVYSRVGGWHWILAVLLVAVALTNSAMIWMLREHRELLARQCRKPFVKQYMAFVCYFTGQQAPVDPRETAEKLLLRSKREFLDATSRAKSAVRGHNNVLDGMFSRIFETLTLRKSRRGDKSLGPLASFLLIGSDGIGKRYLSRVLSKLLYDSGRVEVFECDRLTAESLIGIKGRVGDLLELVKSRAVSVAHLRRDRPCIARRH